MPKTYECSHKGKNTRYIVAATPEKAKARYAKIAGVPVGEVQIKGEKAPSPPSN